MNTSRNLIFIGLCVLLFGGYYMYKFTTKTNESNMEKNDKGSPEPAAAHTPEIDANVIEKLNHYVGCFNRNGERAHQSLNRYLSWVDKNTGPTGNERNVYGAYTIYGGQYYCDEMEKWEKNAPEMSKLQGAAKDYVLKMKALETMLKQIEAYYDAEDYKDDNFAKGKAMHKPLLSTFQAFFESENQFRAAFAQELEKMTFPKDKLFEIYAKAVGLQNLMISPTTSVQTMQEAIRLSEEKMTELETQDATLAQEHRSFLDGVVRFLKNAKDVMRNLRDHKYETGSKQWNVEIRNLTSALNSVQDSYNRISPKGEEKRLKQLYLEFHAD